MKDILTFDEDIMKLDTYNRITGKKYVKYGNMKKFLFLYPVVGNKKFKVVIDGKEFDFDFSRSEIAHINNISRDDINLYFIKNNFMTRSPFIALINSMNEYNFGRCLDYLNIVRESVLDKKFEEVNFPLVTYQDSYPLNLNEPVDFQFIIDIVIQKYRNNHDFISFDDFEVLQQTNRKFELALCELICNIENLTLIIYDKGYQTITNTVYLSKVVLYKNANDQYIVII